MKLTTDTLLEALGEKSDWVDARTLADTFQVTPRTVRNYVRRANERAGRTVVESSHRGYRLAKGAEGDATRAAVSTTAVPREDRLLCALVARTKPQSIYDLADELHVSESTLQAVLRAVRSRVAAEGLRVSRRRDLVWVEGPERSKRRLLGRVLRAYPVAEFPSMEAMLPNGDQLVTPEAHRRARDLLDAHGLSCTDFGLDNLLAHLEVTVGRVTLGSEMGSSDLDAAAPSADAREAAEDLCNWAEGLTNTRISPTDRVYLALLVEANTRVRTDGGEPTEEGVVEPRDLRIARTAAERVAWAYCLEEFSEEFVQQLAAHIHLLLRRARLGMQVANPLADRVRSEYPLVYDMAVSVANVIEEETGFVVGSDEIAFLAFHVGGYLAHLSDAGGRVRCLVLYLDYRSLQDVTSSRVRAALGHRGEIVLEQRLSEYAPGQVACNLVVTPVAVDVPDGVPQVVIGPIPSGEDERRIAECADELLRARRGDTTSAILRRFIRPDLVRLDLPARDREEVVEALASDCERRGLVGEGFAEQVLERERLSTTAFNNLVAIPHTLSPSAVQPFLYLVINRHPIAWGEQHVNLVLLLGIPPHERESFTNLYSDLLSALVDPLNAASLLESSSYEDAIARLERIIRHERTR